MWKSFKAKPKVEQEYEIVSTFGRWRLLYDGEYYLIEEKRVTNDGKIIWAPTLHIFNEHGTKDNFTAAYINIPYYVVGSMLNSFKQEQ